MHIHNVEVPLHIMIVTNNDSNTYPWEDQAQVRGWQEDQSSK